MLVDQQRRVESGEAWCTLDVPRAAAGGAKVHAAFSNITDQLVLGLGDAAMAAGVEPDAKLA
jgi:hypothetical protein